MDRSCLVSFVPERYQQRVHEALAAIQRVYWQELVAWFPAGRCCSSNYQKTKCYQFVGVQLSPSASAPEEGTVQVRRLDDNLEPRGPVLSWSCWRAFQHGRITPFGAWWAQRPKVFKFRRPSPQDPTPDNRHNPDGKLEHEAAWIAYMEWCGVNNS